MIKIIKKNILKKKDTLQDQDRYQEIGGLIKIIIKNIKNLGLDPKIKLRNTINIINQDQERDLMIVKSKIVIRKI